MEELNNNVPGQEEMESRLWEYIDGVIDPAEKPAIEKLISEHTEWKNKYSELLEFHRSVEFLELEQPSLRFTKNVMEEIARLHIAPAAKQYINKKIVWGIAAFFVTVIVSFLVYGFSQIDWASPGEMKSDVIDRIVDADYGKMFNNTFVNAFMMLNVVLGLMLLDRYLKSRKNKMIEKA